MSELKDLLKAGMEVAIENAIALVKEARKLTAKPKVQAKLTAALQELMKLVPDESGVEAAIQDAEKIGYSGEELQRVRARLNLVRSYRQSDGRKTAKKAKKAKMRSAKKRPTSKGKKAAPRSVKKASTHGRSLGRAGAKSMR